MFLQVGLLDDGFFMYYEDVEFCHRAKKAGWGIVYNSELTVVHLHGGSSKLKQKAINGNRLPRYYYESRIRFFYLTYGWRLLTVTNIFWCLGRIINILKGIPKFKYWPGVKGKWLDIWINWLDPLKNNISKL
ncbi:MAG: hypothetical protein RPU13_15145 [Candidatus Sedimenticola sp. (ex Thyasira tokunagai)]